MKYKKGKIIFILGGAKSGKSSYAIERARNLKQKVAFIATCISADREMKKRIRRHKTSRPQDWKVVEEGKEIGGILVKLKDKYETILIDCLGLWISNLLAENLKDKQIEDKIKDFAGVISRFKANIILVSNEVGMGIVPNNLLARRFRDLVGLTNQMMAKIADEVIFMQSGIPVIIKGDRDDAETK
jgi:adenosylcobinamide kinase/adenosylcobinamide-phosphate guanylyltransferase